jgi:hypothetical protein
MAEQPWLDMFPAQRFPQQGVIEQINLPYRQIIRRSPVCVDLPQFLSA